MKAAISWLATLVVLCLHPLAAAAPAQQGPGSSGYSKPELLVDAEWLEKHRARPDVRVVDMRPDKAYGEGHIPGAVRVEEGPLRNPEERFTYLPKPEIFAAIARKAGIRNKTHVVIYDDQGGKMAARLWYVLNAFGHSRISILNGGYERWVAEKRPMNTEAPNVAASDFRVKVTPEMTCPLPEFLARKPNVVVLDVRSPDEFRGATTSSGAKQAGHVPGAVNLEWLENVTGPNQEFKPAHELKQMYATKGITPDKEIVVHCAGGGRAAQTLFTLKLLGYSKVKVYYGSFGDYSALPNVAIEK